MRLAGSRALMRRFAAAGAVPRARARHVPGRMNQTEERYAKDVLEPRRMAGEVLWWAFEPWKLHLGHRCFYEPDFGLVLADRTIEVHEVKAWWPNQKRIGIEDDARAKIQVAATAFPFLGFVIAAEERARGVTKAWRYEPVLEAAGAPL